MSTKSNHVLGRIELARRSLTVGLGALLIAPAAMAEDNATSAPEAADLKPVVITGSNIPTAESETASPVSIYTAEKIAKMGVTDVSQLMQRLPITSNGGLNGNNGGTGFAEGGTGVSLRGLGLNATLVLLNGRRVAPFGYADGGTITFVNLNSLPLAAIERIEILREGASAIYGADAVAGVINVITKKNFDGLEINARYGNTFSSDMGEQKYNLTYGTHTKDEKTSVLVIADYLKRNSFFNRDRAFSGNTDLTGIGGYNLGSSFGFPGRFVVPRTAPGLVGTPFEALTGTRTLVAPRGTDGLAAPGDYHRYNGNVTNSAPDSDAYNFLQHSQATPDSERYGIFGQIEHQLFGEKMVAFGTFQARRDLEHVELAPAPIDFAGNGSGLGIPLGTVVDKNGYKIHGNQLTIPVSNPFNPFGADLTGGRYRLVEAGNRTYDTTSHTYDFVAGLKGDVDESGRLSYETAINYSRSEDNRFSTDVGVNNLQAALNDLNPATSLNVFGGPNFHNNAATIEGLKVRTTHLANTQLASWDGRIFGELDTHVLKAGKFGYAAGTEYREERFNDIPDELSRAGAIAGSSPSRSDKGSRSVNAAFVEGRIPITSPDWNVPGLYRLEIKAAGRLDSYSDFGQSIVPLIGVAWRPINDDLLLRASYGQSFRPPSLRQLYAGPQDALTGSAITDPLRPDDPPQAQVPIVTSGNTKLRPETSDAWSAGIVFTPKQVIGLRLEAQWLQIKRKNEINTFSQTLPSLSALAAEKGHYTRGPSDGSPGALIDPESGTLAGPLISLADDYTNVGSTITDAVDFGITYELATETAGTWTFGLEVTHTLSFRSEFVAGDGYTEFISTVTSFDGFPAWKAVGSVTWEYRKLTLGAIAYFRDGMDYPDVQKDQTDHVNSYLTFDLRASYRLPYHAKITVGIVNLLDTDPPRYIGEQGQAYLSTVDNPFGRSYYMELSKKF